MGWTAPSTQWITLINMSLTSNRQEAISLMRTQETLINFTLYINTNIIWAIKVLEQLLLREGTGWTASLLLDNSLIISNKWGTQDRSSTITTSQPQIIFTKVTHIFTILTQTTIIDLNKEFKRGLRRMPFILNLIFQN